MRLCATEISFLFGKELNKNVSITLINFLSFDFTYLYIWPTCASQGLGRYYTRL